MRREEEFERDVLKEYFDKTAIGKAPEGFTSKVMSHIYMQIKPVKHEKRSPVPYIYIGMTVLLVIASFFLPAGTLKFPELTLPDKLQFTFPQLGESFSTTPLIIYIVAAVILLVVFDSGLKTLFRREKN